MHFQSMPLKVTNKQPKLNLFNRIEWPFIVIVHVRFNVSIKQSIIAYFFNLHSECLMCSRHSEDSQERVFISGGQVIGGQQQ